MLGEETLDGAEEIQPVLFVPKTVAFVVFDNVRHIDAAFLQRFDDLVALRFFHARIIGALGDEERRFDFVRGKEG